MKYHYLKKGEIIKDGDEVDMCNGWDDEPVWELTNCAGDIAPDPQYLAHRKYRREIKNHRI